VLATAGDLAAAFRLEPGEDLRLAARLGWLLTTRVDLDRLARQTIMLTAAERDVAGHYLVAVALAADPAAGPATVAALARVYRILGLEPDQVFHRLHERSVGVAPTLPGLLSDGPIGASADEQDQPVVVQVAEAAPTGYALPWAAHDPALSADVPLDRATIMRTVAESGAAATLLSAIFDAEDEQPGAAEPPDAAGPEGIAGLDVAHTALLRALTTQPSWTRTEFRSLAAAHGVLPDGALDVLNEAAIDAVGAPVIEDDATLAVDNDVLVELLA
jgi:hypothetical protein